MNIATKMFTGNSNFESTYKELKPMLFVSFIIYSIHFESTYKELKLSEQQSQGVKVDYFESTYKELKLALCRI